MFIGVATVALLSARAFADPDTPPITTLTVFSSSGGQVTLDLADASDNVYQDEDGVWNFESGAYQHGNITIDNWLCQSFVSEDDPFVTADLTVTNNSTGTETFWVLMTLDISGAPVLPDSIMSGGVSATVTNNDFFGGNAFMQNSDDGGNSVPIYRGLIDGTVERTLWEDNFFLEAVGPLQSASDSLSFAPEAGPGASNTISVWLQFDLSADDSATISGIFSVEPVPAPAVLAVFAIAGLGSRRRRR